MDHHRWPPVPKILNAPTTLRSARVHTQICVCASLRSVSPFLSLSSSARFPTGCMRVCMSPSAYIRAEKPKPHTQEDDGRKSSRGNSASLFTMKRN